MSKKLLSLVLAMVMVVGMSMGISIPVKAADGVRYFAGTGSMIIQENGVGNDWDSLYEITNAKIVYSEDYIYFTFTSELGEHSLLLIPETINEYGKVNCHVEYNGVEYDNYYNYSDVFYNNKFNSIKIASSNATSSFYLTGDLDLKEVFPDDTVPKELSSSFYGTGSSSTNEYAVTIGGAVTGVFGEGTTTLTNEQILAQNISIFTFNTLKFDSRTMTSSSINSMKVTVANGDIVSVTINGRAQTPNGNFDTYTITIPIL